MVTIGGLPAPGPHPLGTRRGGPCAPGGLDGSDLRALASQQDLSGVAPKRPCGDSGAVGGLDRRSGRTAGESKTCIGSHQGARSTGQLLQVRDSAFPGGGHIAGSRCLPVRVEPLEYTRRTQSGTGNTVARAGHIHSWGCRRPVPDLRVGGDRSFRGGLGVERNLRRWSALKSKAPGLHRNCPNSGVFALQFRGQALDVLR